MAQGNAVGEVRDLSTRGMFIALRTLQPRHGESVVVHVNPSHARAAIELEAVVRWTSKNGVGIELAAIGERERAVLEGIMTAKCA